MLKRRFERFVYALNCFLDADLVVTAFTGFRAVFIERGMCINLSLVVVARNQRTEHGARKHIATVVVAQIKNQVGDVLLAETFECRHQLIVVVDIKAHIEQVSHLFVGAIDANHLVHVDGRIGKGSGPELDVAFRAEHRSASVIFPGHLANRNLDRPVVYILAQRLVVGIGHLHAVDRRDEIAAHESRVVSRRPRNDRHNRKPDIVGTEAGGLQQINTRPGLRLSRSSRHGSIALQIRVIVHAFLPLPEAVVVVHVILGSYAVEDRGEKAVVAKAVIEEEVFDRTIPQVEVLHIVRYPFVHGAVFTIPLLGCTFGLLHHERGRCGVSFHMDGDRGRTRLGKVVLGDLQPQQRFACHTRGSLHLAPVSRAHSRPPAFGGKFEIERLAFDHGLVLSLPCGRGNPRTFIQIIVVATRHTDRQGQQCRQHPSKQILHV